jgi:pimeloyl-ACP methyl ester carboxylesterase
VRFNKLPAENFPAVLFSLLIAGCAAAVPELKVLAPGEELVILPTRPGVTVRVLLITPATSPKGLFLFFPGGEGSLVTVEGRSKTFFPRLFRERGFITALVDVPSDRPYGVTGTDPFRVSQEHLEDVKKVIDFVSRKWSEPIHLIGHSAGTTSVGYLATVLKDDRIGGVVFTGALGNSPPGRVSLATLPLQDVIYPALFVHHKDDECASFSAAWQQHPRLVNSPRVNFIEVRGGDRSRAIGCSPRDPSKGMSYVHGFSGKEREVVAAITDWVLGKPVPDRIGP